MHDTLDSSRLARIALVALLAPAAGAQGERVNGEWVNWESPHVHPLDLTPGGTHLLAVNTADNRLEVFALGPEGPVHAFAVPVGLDPVSVRAFSDSRAWVVNHVSDSISVVDLTTRNVVATLRTDDEPADVVFAGAELRAYVSCSQANTILFFDPARLAAPAVRIAIDGEDPRALAVSPDGAKVYAAIFESGNGTTVLGGGTEFNINFPPNVVSDPVGPYSGRNPPPNSSEKGGFAPPQAPGNPAAPRVGLIVRRNAAGEWHDDFMGDWSHLVSGPRADASGRPSGWELLDHDLAVLDTKTKRVTYARHLMNACMALAVHPTSGEVTVVGTDATNEVRFEPRLRGKFLRVLAARVAANGAPLSSTDLNPHLTYATSTLPEAQRDRSLGDPRGLVWDASGERGYVTGMGSNNVVELASNGARAEGRAPIEVGEGPTGLALDGARRRLYVLCRFESALSVVDLEQHVESARLPFFDPTPALVRRGRRHLYDTHAHSGLGQIACASCHIDARTDRLAWDLGDPSGAMLELAGHNLAADNPTLKESNVPGRGPFQPFHPMKGPMLTQTLQDIVGHEPLHWRGDRNGLEDFNGAFQSLQGDDAVLTPQEMQAFEDFLATITFPPNPFRDFDNSLPTDLALPGHFTTGRFGPAGQPLPHGNAERGLTRFRTGRLDNSKVQCVTCHTLPTGTGPDARLVEREYRPIAPGPNGERHHMLVSMDGSTNVSMKVPQLRGLYEKTGFDLLHTQSRAGFGLLHDGSVDTLARFLNEPQFSLESDQDTADLVAFLLCFSGSDLPRGSPGNPGSPTNTDEPPGSPARDTHAAVGWQVTLAGAPTPAQAERIAAMLALAERGALGLVVKGRRAELARGWTYTGSSSFQSDRARETTTAAQLAEGAGPGSELTYTLVPRGTARRIGVDRDGDGALDRDELEAGSDPADARSLPPAAAQGEEGR